MKPPALMNGKLILSVTVQSAVSDGTMAADIDKFWLLVFGLLLPCTWSACQLLL
jgi:hypothetical protein